MRKCRPIQCVSVGPTLTVVPSVGPTDVLVSIAVVPASENTALLPLYCRPLYLSVDISTPRYYSLLKPLALHITLMQDPGGQSPQINHGI